MPRITVTAAGQTATVDYEIASSGFLLGARNKDVSFADAQAAVGPLQGARTFMSAGLPTKWATPTDAFTGSKLPTGIAYFVSITQITGNVEPYCASVPAGVDLRLIYKHEVENGKETPAQFQANMAGLLQRVKAVNPSVKVVMASAGQQYDDGDPATDGRYIVPGLDGYYLDFYRPSLQQMRPASTDDRLTNWRMCIPAGKPWGFTEFGLGALDSPDPADQINARRVQVLGQDIAWLKTQPGFDALLYWYTKSSDPTDHNYRFTDPASVAAFKALPRRAEPQ